MVVMKKIGSLTLAAGLLALASSSIANVANGVPTFGDELVATGGAFEVASSFFATTTAEDSSAISGELQQQATALQDESQNLRRHLLNDLSERLSAGAQLCGTDYLQGSCTFCDRRQLRLDSSQNNLLLQKKPWYTATEKTIWQTSISGAATPNCLKMQTNCNAVLYDSAGRALWESATYWYEGANCYLQLKSGEDFFYIRRPDGSPIKKFGPGCQTGCWQ